MLPKGRRLTRRQFAGASVKTLVVSRFSLSFRYKKAPLPGRFSVVVPKTVAKAATTRNKIRRALYSVFEKKTLPFDGVVYVKSLGEKGLKTPLLMSDLETILKNIKP